MIRCFSSFVCILLCSACYLFAAEPPWLKHPELKFQYRSEGIEIEIPTPDEPRVREFNQQTAQAALNYLEGGALVWVREKGCVNCHTTGPYMTERTALSNHFGPPSEEVYKNFISDIPSDIGRVKTVHRGTLSYKPRSYYAVWRSMGLAEWDRHVGRELTGATKRSLQDMFERQAENGSFVSYGEVEIPHITTDFELTLQAARAVSSAPGWLENLEDSTLLNKVARMKDWLRTAEPKNDFDRVLRLQLRHYFPDLVSDGQKQLALELLTEKQHRDGGWSVRDMSKLENWHYEISDYVTDLVQNLPDARAPESDPYMTALAIVLLRQTGVESSDERIQRGINWLKKEQRVSGRWWMHSLYRGNYHYITYIATCQALKALALCDEL